LGHGRAVPEHSGRPLSSIYGNLVNIPAAHQTGFAEARKVGGHHLVGNEGRAKAAIGSDEAVRLRVGVDVARLVNHLVDGDALDPRRQAQSESLDDVRRLLIQTDHEARTVHRPARVVGGRGIGLVDPDGLVQAVLLHRLTKKAGDLVDCLRLEVDVQSHDVKIVIVLRSSGILGDDVQEPLEVLPSAIHPVPPVGQPRQVDDAVGVSLLGSQIGYL
jgi:hypothetical protein